MSTRILVRKPDTLILRATLAEVMATNQASFGMAYAFKNEMVVQRGAFDFSKGVEPQLDAMEGLQDSIKEAKAAFSFSTIKWNKSDEQPFSILMNGESHVIVGFVGDGDYSKHVKGRTEHSPEFYAAMEYLQPQIYELVKATNGDPAKLVEAIQEKAEELSAGLGSGSACLLIADGSCPVIRSADYMGESQDWGWISSPLVDRSSIDKSKDQKPALNLLGNSQKPTLTLALPTTLTAEEGRKLTEQTSVKSGAEINAERKETGNLLDRVWARPKTTAHKPKDFYERYNPLRGKSGRGFIPNNFRDRPPIEVDKKYVGQKDFDNMAEVCDAPSEADLKSSTAPAAIAAPGYQAAQSVNVGMTQVTAADKNRLLEDLQWKGYTNTAGGRSADDIAKDETKRPSYYELTGLSIHDLKAHTAESILWLQQNHPSIANATFMELLRQLPTQAASPANKQNPEPKSVSSPAPGKPTLQLAI